MSMYNAVPEKGKLNKSENAKSVLGWVALFLGEVRDGLTMINMQNAFLVTSKFYTEKQAGVMFFVFGMSQFLFQTPAGYLMDYSDRKIALLAAASISTTIMTIITAIFAQEYGRNFLLMVLIKFLQGAVTALIPPGLNSITQGIVGSVGMTEQVSKNEMMNHLGTAIIVLAGSVLAYIKYPDIGMLFVVSPIACAGVLYFLFRINPDDIDHNAARGLVLESNTTTDDATPAAAGGGTKQGVDGAPYSPPLFDADGNLTNKDSDDKQKVQTNPSFNFGWGSNKNTPSTTSANNSNNNNATDDVLRADTPLQVLRDPTLVIFIFVVFLFHTSNGTVLPLVMQTLALGNGPTGILGAGFCIIVAQAFMVLSAKICGTYSRQYGRKGLFLIGFFTVPVRCFILTMLEGAKESSGMTPLLQILFLSTQILDGVGAGTFGTMYILVTSDISGGTGRFSMTLGLTTAAVSIGGTVSGYLGQALAQDRGYRSAFFILGFMALVPALVYLFFMPETLPDYAKVVDSNDGQQQQQRQGQGQQQQQNVDQMTSIEEGGDEVGGHTKHKPVRSESGSFVQMT